MISQVELTRYLNKYLNYANITDYCPNGLQVAGTETICKVVTGVTACQALLDKAVELQADAVLVHHGYFWRGENPCVLGPKRQRLATLLQHNINLFSYHLPLDLHSVVGNNVQLAKRLDIDIIARETSSQEDALVFLGSLKTPQSLAQFQQHITKTLNRTPLVIPGHNREINTIAWCTGGAQNFIEHAAHLEADAYLSGEISERTTHMARELGIHYIAAGHHATERYGILALGEHLAETFGLDVDFVDIDNPA